MYEQVLPSAFANFLLRIVDAIRKIQAEGASMCEAHEDMEIFRLRLMKCLNYEANEDSYNGLFQRREPREAGPLLDIERAMNKVRKLVLLLQVDGCCSWRKWRSAMLAQTADLLFWSSTTFTCCTAMKKAMLCFTPCSKERRWASFATSSCKLT
jgi:hypothetical protein